MKQQVFDFDEGTNEDVQRAITSAFNTRERIRVFYGIAATGKDWMEENDVTGYIGRSTGVKKAPLLVKYARSMGGGSLITSSIVKIVRTSDGCVLYQNPKYTIPTLIILTNDGVEYPYGVYCVTTAEDGVKSHNVQARFTTIEQAERYRRFIRGDRHHKAGRINMTSKGAK